MSMSTHADTRAKQRGIPPLVVEWLERFGEEQHDHHGAVILHFSKRSTRRLERAVGRDPVRRMNDYLRCYAVVKAGTVITVGKRYKRVRT